MIANRVLDVRRGMQCAVSELITRDGDDDDDDGDDDHLR